MHTTVRDLLIVKGDQIWTISPDATVFSAIDFLADKKVGALLVLEKDQIVGIISERDIVRQIAMEQTCKLGIPVREVMTREVVTVSPETDIEECMQLMTDEHIRHLPVLEGGKVIGLVSIGDVVKAVINSKEYTIEQLSKYIGGEGYNT